MPGTYTTVMSGEEGTVAGTALASQEPTGCFIHSFLKERCALLFCDIPGVRTAPSGPQDLCAAPRGQLLVAAALTRARLSSPQPPRSLGRPPLSLVRASAAGAQPLSPGSSIFVFNEIRFRSTAHGLDVYTVHKTIPAVAPTPPAPRLSGRPPAPPHGRELSARRGEHVWRASRSGKGRGGPGRGL